MSKVFSAHAVSVDGYISGRTPDGAEEFGRGLGDAPMLFDLYFDGDTPSQVFDGFKLSEPNARFFDAIAARVGAAVAGRTTYEHSPSPLRGGPMILVTGGLGMIGAHTACALADLGHEVGVTAYHRTEVRRSSPAGSLWNPGSIWGPLMDPESPFNHIPPYISAALRGEEPQPLYADDGGDSCYAPDAGRAIALLTTAETLRHDTYNVSSGRPFINRELADALQAITPGLRLDLRPGRQAGPGDNPYLDTTRLTHDTGFTPAFNIAAAVADYVAWRAGNPR